MWTLDNFSFQKICFRNHIFENIFPCNFWIGTAQTGQGSQNILVCWCLKYRKFQIVFTIIYPLSNANLNAFLKRLWKLFYGVKYSREETIHGNTVLIKCPLTKFLEPLKPLCPTARSWYQVTKNKAQSNMKIPHDK